MEKLRPPELKPQPATVPIAETNNDSPKIMRATWPRENPQTRAMASSLMRPKTERIIVLVTLSPPSRNAQPPTTQAVVFMILNCE